MHEVGRGTVERADRLAQTWSRTVRLVGDPDEIPRFDTDDEPLPTVDWASLPSLADLVVGESPGRTADDKITLFLERGLGSSSSDRPVRRRAGGRGGTRKAPPDGVFRQNLKP